MTVNGAVKERRTEQSPSWARLHQMIVNTARLDEFASHAVYSWQVSAKCLVRKKNLLKKVEANKSKLEKHMGDGRERPKEYIFEARRIYRQYVLFEGWLNEQITEISELLKLQEELRGEDDA